MQRPRPCRNTGAPHVLRFPGPAPNSHRASSLAAAATQSSGGRGGPAEGERAPPTSTHTHPALQDSARSREGTWGVRGHSLGELIHAETPPCLTRVGALARPPGAVPAGTDLGHLENAVTTVSQAGMPNRGRRGQEEGQRLRDVCTTEHGGHASPERGPASASQLWDRLEDAPFIEWGGVAGERPRALLVGEVADNRGAGSSGRGAACRGRWGPGGCDRSW